MRDRWRQTPRKTDYELDAETSQRVFRRNIRVMLEQGASVRDIAIELSRKRDGDYLGEPKAAIQQRVEELVRELGLKVRVPARRHRSGPRDHRPDD